MLKRNSNKPWEIRYLERFLLTFEHLELLLLLVLVTWWKGGAWCKPNLLDLIKGLSCFYLSLVVLIFLPSSFLNLQLGLGQGIDAMLKCLNKVVLTRQLCCRTTQIIIFLALYDQVKLNTWRTLTHWKLLTWFSLFIKLFPLFLPSLLNRYRYLRGVESFLRWLNL